MNLYNLIFIISIFIFSFQCCNKKDSSPTQSTDKIVKSQKRGIAYNLTDPADLDTLKRGVSWWYNWHYKTDALFTTALANHEYVGVDAGDTVKSTSRDARYAEHPPSGHGDQIHLSNCRDCLYRAQ